MTTTDRPTTVGNPQVPATTVAENKELARRVMHELAQGRADIIAEAFGPGWVDHATPAKEDLASLAQHVRDQHSAHPQATTEIYRVLGEGDLVFVHSHLVLDPGTLGFAVADIYRFEDGRIVEHWGASQEVPATTVSGNDMFSTLSAPQRLDPDPEADPDQTRDTTVGLMTTIVANKDLDAWDRFAVDPYYQHSINTPNGIEAVKEVWGPLLLDTSLDITLVNVITDGDLIVAQDLVTKPGFRMEAFDISRVRDGKIVEHWDVLQYS